MSTSVDKPVSAHHRQGKIHVAMESGLELAFPVTGNPRLEGQAHASIDNLLLWVDRRRESSDA